MIISASYKTDIPAFYGEWFQNRLRAGFCRMVNPYNRKQHYAVSLRREDVDGFIFWTKNLTPFMAVLDEVHQSGFPFITQYTINGYPRSLESRVVDARQSVRTFRSASERYGAASSVWRYDTIIFSSATDVEFHRKNFTELASALAGYTDEVVVSFMQVYKKTRANMNMAGQEHDFSWEDPPAQAKRSLLAELIEIAGEFGMTLSICTQPELMVPGASEARCIDGERLTRVAGRTFRSKIKGMRPGCGCYESKDIGEYDTCPHGCVYCYAVRQRPLALQRYHHHNPLGEYLFPQTPLPPVNGEPLQPDAQEQLPLFPPA